MENITQKVIEKFLEVYIGGNEYFNLFIADNINNENFWELI